jgi:hypothetical protein
MVWDVISNQWFWLGAAGFFTIVLAILLTIAHRQTVRKVKKSQEGGWSPTGRIDFAGPSEGDPDTSGSFLLQAEDMRVVRGIGVIDHHEIRWRKATLNEAKRVVSSYHAQLAAAAARVRSADKALSESEREDSPHVEAPSLSPLP